MRKDNYHVLILVVSLCMIILHSTANANNIFGPDYKKLIDILIEEIAKHPNNSATKEAQEKLLTYVSSAKTVKSHYEGAVNALESAIEQYSADVNLHYVLACLYLDGRNYSMAKMEYEKVVALNKTHSGANMYLGSIAFIGKDIVNALMYYKRAVAGDKNNIRAYLLMNMILVKEKRYNEAIEVLEQAKENNQREMKVYYNLAINYSMLEKTDNAILNAKKAIALEPSASNYHILGLAYYQKKDIKNATGAFMKGYEVDPRNKNIIFGLCQSLFLDGRRNEAIEIMRHAEKIYPDDTRFKKKIEEYSRD